MTCPRSFGRNLRLAVILAALPLLGGCVAALVPVAASGALLGKDRIAGKNNSDPESEVASEPAPDATSGAAAEEPVATAELSAPLSNPVVAEPVAEAVETAAAVDAGLYADSTGNVAAAEAGQQPQEDAASPNAATELPPAASAKNASTQIASVSDFDFPAAPNTGVSARAPTLASPAPMSAPMSARAPIKEAAPASATPQRQTAPLAYGPADYRAYDALYSYVDSQARRDPVDSPRQSALLAAPGSLSPIRTQCSIRPPAILVDLDPDGAIFDPSAPAAANPALTQLLGTLRLQEVEIFWISELSAIKAGAVRKALIDSGMDPVGRDGLLLMRRGEDRKQERRKELADTHCLLAIAGDTRADFDELFLYLRDRSAAQPLEALIGAGWFLTPLPLRAAPNLVPAATPSTTLTSPEG